MIDRDKRKEIEDRILSNQSRRAIARDTGVSEGTVHNESKKLDKSMDKGRITAIQKYATFFAEDEDLEGPDEADTILETARLVKKYRLHKSVPTIKNVIEDFASRGQEGAFGETVQEFYQYRSACKAQGQDIAPAELPKKLKAQMDEYITREQEIETQDATVKANNRRLAEQEEQISANDKLLLEGRESVQLLERLGVPLHDAKKACNVFSNLRDAGFDPKKVAEDLSQTTSLKSDIEKRENTKAQRQSELTSIEDKIAHAELVCDNLNAVIAANREMVDAIGKLTSHGLTVQGVINFYNLVIASSAANDVPPQEAERLIWAYIEKHYNQILGLEKRLAQLKSDIETLSQAYAAALQRHENMPGAIELSLRMQSRGWTKEQDKVLQDLLLEYTTPELLIGAVVKYGSLEKAIQEKAAQLESAGKALSQKEKVIADAERQAHDAMAKWDQAQKNYEILLDKANGVKSLIDRGQAFAQAHQMSQGDLELRTAIRLNAEPSISAEETLVEDLEYAQRKYADPYRLINPIDDIITRLKVRIRLRRNQPAA